MNLIIYELAVNEHYTIISHLLRALSFIQNAQAHCGAHALDCLQSTLMTHRAISVSVTSF
jgi:hypothetical protein